MKITIFPLSPLRGEGAARFSDSIFLNFQLCSDRFFDSKTPKQYTLKFMLVGTVGGQFLFLLPSCIFSQEQFFPSRF